MRTIGSTPDTSITIETDEVTRPYWEALRERRLTAPRCGDCGTFHMPPSPFCPNCLSRSIHYPALAGSGTVYSFSIVPGSPKQTPSVAPEAIGLVELTGADGCRLFTRFVDIAPEDVRIDMRVRVRWQEVNDGWLVPWFGPADTAE